MSSAPITVRFSTDPYRPRVRRPLATETILAVTVLTFLVMTLVDFLSHPPIGDFLLRTFTGASADPELLIRFGASYGPYIRRGEYFRLIMPTFLHVGMLHLLINAYALYILGRILEQMYGYGRFALIYVGCGIGSAALSMTVSLSVSAGASGAIFGIAGAMLVAGYLHREAVPPHWKRAFGRGMLPFILLNLILGFSIRSVLPIDNWGHVGGLLTGILLALVIPPPKPHEEAWAAPEASGQFQISALPAILIVVAGMFWTVKYFRTYSEVTRLLEQGERYAEHHQPDRAQALFEQALGLAPRDERSHEELASLYLVENRLTDAVREANVALGLNPAAPEAQATLVAAYKRLGDMAHVNAILKEMEAALPPGAESQAALADLFVRQQLYAEAIQHYEAALKLKPDFAPAQNNLAWLLSTADDPAFRNPRQALEHAKRAVELSGGKEATFIDTLAEALYVNRDYSQAVETEARALELDPNDEEFREHMERYRKAAQGTKL
jgi:membrane associated rhomboid family serine protease/tetratricopeptide (TPR) repeat protein